MQKQKSSFLTISFLIIGGFINILSAENEITDNNAVDTKKSYYEIGIESPYLAEEFLNQLLVKKEFCAAKEDTIKIIEYWLEKRSHDINTYSRGLLKLAQRLDTDFYYTKILDKITGRWSLENVNPFLLSFKSEFSEDNSQSLTEFLINRIKVNPIFLERYKVDMDTLRKMFEFELHELLSQDDLIFTIMHALALHGKENFSFSVKVFKSNKQNDDILVGGEYNFITKGLNIYYDRISVELRKTLIHEWTHQLMDILYNNMMLPYSKEDHEKKVEFNAAMQRVNKLIKCAYGHSNDSDEKFWLLSRTGSLSDSTGNEALKSIFNKVVAIKYSYKEMNHAAEYIVMLPEMLSVKGLAEDPLAQTILQPIIDYWNKFIAPDIKNYIDKRANLDEFVSDIHRKHFLQPAYSQILESKEYESDLYDVNINKYRGHEIGVKWLKRGNIEKALQFHREFYDNYSTNSPAGWLDFKWLDSSKESDDALEWLMKWYPKEVLNAMYNMSGNDSLEKAFKSSETFIKAHRYHSSERKIIIKWFKEKNKDEYASVLSAT